MISTTETRRELRGVKRICGACEVRFYDLSRDPIICPACGAENAPDSRPVAPPVAAYTAKTTWRRNTKRQEPVHAVEAEAVEPAETETADVEDIPADTTVAPTSADDIVLENDADDADVSDLVVNDEDERRD